MKLQLHRAQDQADWEKLPRVQWNGWQKLAAATGGFVTLANFFTLVGFLSVPAGLVMIVRGHMYIFGAVVLLAGRLCDVIDGYAAEFTHTKSPLGEALDASLDKVATIATVVVLGITGVVAWWILAALALPHVVITLLAVLAYRRSQRLHPAASGKLAMAAGWLSLLCFVVWRRGTHRFGMGIGTVSYVLLGLSLVYGAVAIRGYWRMLGHAQSRR